MAKLYNEWWLVKYVGKQWGIRQKKTSLWPNKFQMFYRQFNEQTKWGELKLKKILNNIKMKGIFNLLFLTSFFDRINNLSYKYLITVDK